MTVARFRLISAGLIAAATAACVASALLTGFDAEPQSTPPAATTTTETTR